MAALLTVHCRRILACNVQATRNLVKCIPLAQKNNDLSKCVPLENCLPFRRKLKVTVAGAAGRVGRMLSLLLKSSPSVDQLSLFDIDEDVCDVAQDLFNINTACKTSWYCGLDNMRPALERSDVVVIAAGCPSTSRVSPTEQFKANAPVVAELAEACAQYCHKACLVVITNPINSLVPVVAETLYRTTGQNPQNRVFGLSALDAMRANTFVAEATKKNPQGVVVPVVGGCSADTVVPVFSQTRPCCELKQEEVEVLTECVKQAELMLEDCRTCGTSGASTLTTAYAAFRFTSALMAALSGGKDIVECAYVMSNVLPGLEYMTSPLLLGQAGVKENYGYPKLSDYEVKLLEEAACHLMHDIRLGKQFVCEMSRKNLELAKIKENIQNPECVKESRVGRKIEMKSPCARLEVKGCKDVTADMDLSCHVIRVGEKSQSTKQESDICDKEEKMDEEKNQSEKHHENLRKFSRDKEETCEKSGKRGGKTDESKKGEPEPFITDLEVDKKTLSMIKQKTVKDFPTKHFSKERNDKQSNYGKVKCGGNQLKIGEKKKNDKETKHRIFKLKEGIWEELKNHEDEELGGKNVRTFKPTDDGKFWIEVATLQKLKWKSTETNELNSKLCEEKGVGEVRDSARIKCEGGRRCVSASKVNTPQRNPQVEKQTRCGVRPWT